MAKVRARRGKLFFDFVHLGVRCREQSALEDTPKNRRTMQQVADKIGAEILLGTFYYESYFPGGASAQRIASAVAQHCSTQNGKNSAGGTLIKDFANAWYDEIKHTWRRSHASTVRSTIDLYIIPKLGEIPINELTRSVVLRFRGELTDKPMGRRQKPLNPKTVNRIVMVLGQIMDEASDRFEFTNPMTRIKRLKTRKTDIFPFTLEEVQLLIDTVREDYRDYLITRFFTGLRSGEINGLQWKYVDFNLNQLLIREAIVRGELEYTKTDGSQRNVRMSTMVVDALKRRKEATGSSSQFVFCTSNGTPIDPANFTNQVWHPLLRHLGLAARPPMQTRHTCATLWLASGENPEWIASQLGHVDTTMLFKTYSRFVPDLTRKDGSAFDRLISQNIK